MAANIPDIDVVSIVGGTETYFPYIIAGSRMPLFPLR